MTNTDFTTPLNHSGEQQDVYLARSTSNLIDLASQADATPRNPVGCITRYKGNLYRYVCLDTGSGTTVLGAPAYIHHLDPTSTDPTKRFAVTEAASAAIDAKGYNVVAGVFLAASITANTYIWIQVGGVATCKVDTSTVFGDMHLGGSNDVFVRVAIGASLTDEPFGVALAADTAGLAPVLLRNMAW